MNDDKNPAQRIHAKGHEARLAFCIRVRDRDRTHVTERLLCVGKADAMLAEVGLCLSGSNSISMRIVCILYTYQSRDSFPAQHEARRIYPELATPRPRC
jgi:hypothetical protein